MKTGEFKVLSEFFNVRWLGRWLLLQKHTNDGIDLFDRRVGVEVKCKYSPTDYVSWAVHAYQVEQFRKDNPNRSLFWAFVSYNLSSPASDLSAEEFPDAIVNRKAWLVDWSSIGHLPRSNAKTGPYIYVKPSDLQGEFSSFEHNGTIYVPKGSCLEKRLAVPAKQSG